MDDETTPHCDGRDMPSVADTLTPGGSKGTPRAIMRSADKEYADLKLRVLAGSLPPDLLGHVFIAGPRVHRGTPALSSNGIVYRVDLHGAEAATLTSSVMRTAGYYLRRAVNKLGYLRRPFVDPRLSEFRAVGLGQFSVTLGAQELPNTAPVVIPSTGRMVITTDAGRPWQIDPATLRALSPLGYLREWKRALGLPWMLPLLQTTAHATVDPHTSDLYISNHAPDAPPCKPFTQVCRWSESDPRVRHWHLVDDVTGAEIAVQTLHQLVITKNHVVMLDSDFPVDLPGAMSALLHPWLPIPTSIVERLSAPESSAVASVWVVRKADLIDSPETLSPDAPPTVKARRFVLGAGGLHFAVEYNDETPTGHKIRLVVSHTPSEDLTHVLRAGEPLALGGTVPDYLDGMLTPVPIIRGQIGVHEIDLDRGLVDSRMHGSDLYTWGVAVFSHAGVLQGELDLLRGQADHERCDALKDLWFNSGGFTPDLLSKELYDLYRNRGWPIDTLPREIIPSSVFRFNTESRDFDGFSLPLGWYAFAPTFVPSAKKGAAREDGYLVVTVVSDPTPALPEASSGDEIWIFEAQNIARGPLCRLGHPELQFGMTLHSMWTATLHKAPETHRVDMRKDLDLDEIKARYLRFFGEELPFPWKQALGPIRDLARYALDFKDLQRALELEVFPYFDA